MRRKIPGGKIFSPRSELKTSSSWNHTKQNKYSEQDKSNILVQFNQLSVSKPAHKSVIYQSSKAGKKASISIRAHGEKRKTSLKL